MFEESQVQEGQNQSEESTPEVNNSDSQNTTEKQIQDIIDLDKIEKFRFQGREWSPKDWQNGVMMQSDYTRKTQALSEERKYYDNLQADLETLAKNPHLAEEFKKVYPEKFHNYLNYVLPKQAEAKTQQSANDPRVEELLQFKQAWEEDRVNAHLKAIEAMEAKFTQKYPQADSDRVIASAQAWRQKNPQTKEIPENVWEQLYKADHARNEQRFKEWQSQQVKKQMEVNAQGKDTPSGGGVPAQGPVKFRTIKEASEALRSSNF